MCLPNAWRHQQTLDAPGDRESLAIHQLNGCDPANSVCGMRKMFRDDYLLAIFIIIIHSKRVPNSEENSFCNRIIYNSDDWHLGLVKNDTKSGS